MCVCVCVCVCVQKTHHVSPLFVTSSQASCVDYRKASYKHISLTHINPFVCESSLVFREIRAGVVDRFPPAILRLDAAGDAGEVKAALDALISLFDDADQSATRLSLPLEKGRFAALAKKSRETLTAAAAGGGEGGGAEIAQGRFDLYSSMRTVQGVGVSAHLLLVL